MALMDNIMQQFQNLGFGNMDYNDISNLSPEAIQSKLREKFGLEVDDLNPGMFQTIDQGLVEGMMGKQYSGFLESQSQDLLTKLLQSSSGKKVNKAAGGFAGSGNLNQLQSAAKDVYGKGMSGAISGVQEKQSSSANSILDAINSWRDKASEITG